MLGDIGVGGGGLGRLRAAESVLKATGWPFGFSTSESASSSQESAGGASVDFNGICEPWEIVSLSRDDASVFAEAEDIFVLKDYPEAVTCLSSSGLGKEIE